MVAASLYECRACHHPEHLEKELLVGASQTATTHVGEFCFGCPACEEKAQGKRRVS